MAKSQVTDLQMILLTIASRRKHANIHPLPSAVGIDTEAIDAAIEGLRSAKLVEEAEAKDIRQVWREVDGQRIALVLNSKGKAAAARETTKGREEVERSSKIGAVITLLLRPEGATLEQMVNATGWLPHTTRAALTGLKKKGYVISSEKVAGLIQVNLTILSELWRDITLRTILRPRRQKNGPG